MPVNKTSTKGSHKLRAFFVNPMLRIYVLFLTAFVAANLIVKYTGPPGLWISSFFLIPFDFVCRCIIHEKLKGARLFLVLFSLTAIAAGLTVLINWQARNIAIASVAGFCAAQLFAGLVYQALKKQPYFIKVNGSDLVAIIFDSIVFQYIAFNILSMQITAGQILIKIAGGLLWYYIIFKIYRYDKKIDR